LQRIGHSETTGILDNPVERHEHARNDCAHFRSPVVNKWSEVQGTLGLFSAVASGAGGGNSRGLGSV
jgi:hypothetical protein